LSTPFDIGPPASDAEYARFAEILCECFCSPMERRAGDRERVGEDNMLLVRRGGEVIGGLFLLPFGQWFGGKVIPTIGIAAVGIAPEHRGSGAARALMDEAVRETRRRGAPLSALYPATHTLYRKSGYELAGSYNTIIMDPPRIPAMDRTLTMRAADKSELPIMQELYARVSAEHDGWLERSPLAWQRIVDPWDNAPRIQFILDGDEPVGYCCYRTEKHDVHDQTITFVDLITTTRAATQRLLTFIADHRSLVQKAIWHGPANDSLIMALPERCYTVEVMVDWMLRIVDVEQALTQRGYAPGLSAEVHFQIVDDVLNENEGNWVLHVASGAGKLERGGEGHLRCHAGGLAPLFTGFMAPSQLVRAGLLAGDPEHLRAAAPIFATGQPNMVDLF
jgi:predicted acetyltransferase